MTVAGKNYYPYEVKSASDAPPRRCVSCGFVSRCAQCFNMHIESHQKKLTHEDFDTKRPKA